MIQGGSVLAPFDAHPDQGGIAHNLCEPQGQDLLFRMAWSGCVAAAHAAPPCGDMSMIKLLPGGPPPRRSPEALHGWIGQSPTDMLAVQDSCTVHRCVIEALNAIWVMGGHVTWENPPSSMALLHDEVTAFLVRVSAIVFPVARCQFDPTYFKEYLIATTIASLRENLESKCTHSFHEPWAGRRDANGKYLSSGTALYPDGMATIYAQQVSPMLGKATSTDYVSYNSILVTPPHVPSSLSKQDDIRKKLTADGGGRYSYADWFSPPKDLQDVLQPLRGAWVKVIKDNQLLPKLTGFLQSPGETSPWAAADVLLLRATLVKFLKDSGIEANDSIEPGQPFCINILAGLQTLLHDEDTSLMQHLTKGVPLGVDAPIEPSGIWIPRQTVTSEDVPDLLLCESNWGSATQNPGSVNKIIDRGIGLHRLQVIKGGLQEAKKRWGDRIAIGKLGLIQVEGKKDRLVGDSTVCGVTGRIQLRERIYLPVPEDVDSTMLNQCRPQHLNGFSIDVEAAHNTVRVMDEDHGLLLFMAPDGRLVGFTVCHFGGRSSAYWWSRVGALLMRLGHRIIYVSHAGFLYVDDFLWLLKSAVAPLHACLLLALFLAIGVPISWRKLRLGQKIEWIGWVLNFKYNIWELQAAKLSKALAFLTLVAQGCPITRKEMEQGTGFMLWLTNRFPMHRRFLSSFWSCLRWGGVRNVALSRDNVILLLSLLADNLVVMKDTPHAPFKRNWHLLSLGAVDVTSLQQARSLRAVGSRRTWARFHSEDSTELNVPEDLKLCARTWCDMLRNASPVTPLLPTSIVVELACAADAFAEGDSASIGGWVIPEGLPVNPGNAFWFAAPLTRADFEQFVSMPGNLQKAISSLEAFAQTVLMVMKSKMCPEQFGCQAFAQESDSMSALGAVNKQCSTAWPLAFFVRNFVHWSERLRYQINIRHLPGKENVWADGLSRQDVGTIASFNPERRFKVDLAALLEPPRLEVSDKFQSKSQALRHLLSL